MISDKLYGLAFEYKKTKLWKKLWDTQAFAVKLSEDRMGYICIMGGAGGHCALGMFIGAEGFSSFLSISETNPLDMSPLEFQEHILQQDCLQCAFEGKDQLNVEEQEDAKAYARSHGIRISGRNAYPHFFKCQPNRLPWHLQTEREVEDLCEGLAAGVEIARRLEEETPEALGLEKINSESQEILMIEREGQAWKLGRTAVPERVLRKPPFPKARNQIGLANLKKLKRSGIWECGIIRFPQPVQEDPEEAPVFPALLLAVESSTEYLLQVPPVESYEDDPEKLLNLFMEALLEAGIRPIRIKARDERTYAFVKDFCDKLKVPLSMEDHMPALDDVEADFTEHFSMEGEDEDEEVISFEEMINDILNMDERQLRTMPPELVDMFKILLRQGVLPEEVQDKLERVLGMGADNKTKQRSIRTPGKKKRTDCSYVISVSLGTGCYRHIQISGECTLMELHAAILDAFEFYDAHAHAFFMDNISWSDADSYFMPGMESEDRTTDVYTLEQAGLEKGMKFKYVYDFGMEWTFQCKVLRVEEVITPMPKVLKRKGEAPDQDEDW